MKKIISLLLAAMLVLLAACSGQTDKNQTDIEKTGTIIADSNGEAENNDGSSEGKAGDGLSADYEKVISDAALSPADLLEYIRENAERATAEETAGLLLRLEQLQKGGLEAMTDRYSANDSFQTELLEIYNFEANTVDINKAETESLKELLKAVQDGGYKTETAEASFFPVIDYSIYTEFTGKLQEDLKAYFEIMAAESSQAPAKDGSLVIGWDEVIHRALAQQQFILTYEDSGRLQEVKELYSKYTAFIFGGLPNTPDFMHDTKILSPGLKQSFTDIAAQKGVTPLEKKIGAYLDILEKNEFKLTDEVKQFRDNAVSSIDN